jgi:hypothetical protein
MAIKTTLEQIEEVQAAISAVMSGQSYTMDGRALNRADLRSLTERETMLLDRHKRERGTGGPAINRVIPRREY